MIARYHDRDSRGRRMRIVGSVAAILLLLAVGMPASHAALREVTLRIARIPFAQGMVPVTQYMIQERLVERFGATLGFPLKVEWKDFPSGRPIVDGLIAGQLDIGSVGFVPTTVAIAQKAPVHVLANAEGRVKFYLVVPAGSPIRTVQDLRGKTVGVIIGTDMHVFLNRLLDLELGTADYARLGIRIQALQTLAQLANPPRGIDATPSTEAPYIKAANTGAVTAIVNSYGFTEDHYQGPLGTGSGLELPARKKSPFFPEGIYMHRNFWLVHSNALSGRPRAVTAFLMALEQALRDLRKWSYDDIGKLVFKYWELNVSDAKAVWLNDLNSMRGWSWITEGDIRAIVDQSQYAKATEIIAADVDWQTAIANLRPVVSVTREAYERMDSRPALTVFQVRANVFDIRGLPVWELSNWKVGR